MRSSCLPILLAIATLACAAHPAAAAGPVVLDATAAGVLLEGALRLEGTLAALASTGNLDPSQAPQAALAPTASDARVAPTALRLAAHRLRAETDISHRSGPPLANLRQDGSAAASFDGAVAHALPARAGFQAYLAPLPGHEPPRVRMEAALAHLAPTPAAPAEPERKVPSATRGPLAAAPGPAALATGGLRTLHVEGDLALTLWEWDLDVTSAGVVLRSGYAYTPTTPSARGVDTAGESESRQLFLYAEGATLDLTLPDGAAVALALQPRSATLDGRLGLERPSGSLTTLEGGRPLRDGDWVEGALAASLSDLEAGSLHLRGEGTGRAARLEGAAVTIAGPASAPGPPLLLAAAGVAAVGGWRLWGRRPSARPPHIPPEAPAAPTAGEADEMGVLRWLEAASRQDGAAVLWDSDVMRAFDWSAERAQLVLRSLQAKGHVHCKDVALAGGRFSLGHISLTGAGSDRLQADGPGGAGGGSGAGRLRAPRLRRLASWLPPG